MTQQAMKQGDFSILASMYRHRVGYSPHVLNTLKNSLGKKTSSIDVADVGAGTGKLTEVLCELGLRVHSVEPNKEMREEGIRQTAQLSVDWTAGSGEETGLETGAYDWVLMGSSFHWVNFEKGIAEFSRLLRPNGMFTAIWNPRDLERDILQKRIDTRIKEMVPSLVRKSSGGTAYAENWTDKLASTTLFKDVTYIESPFTVRMTRDRYMGIWDSINDIRAQAGELQWRAIRKMIESEIGDKKELDVHYLTRAWTVWKA